MVWQQFKCCQAGEHFLLVNCMIHQYFHRGTDGLLKGTRRLQANGAFLLRLARLHCCGVSFTSCFLVQIQLSEGTLEPDGLLNVSLRE